MPRLRQPPKETAPRASVRFEQQEEPKPKVENEPFEQEHEEEPVVKAAEAQAEKESVAELKKLIEAHKIAEQQQRDRADKAERAERLAREVAKAKDAEFEKVRTDFTQSRAEVISTAIAKETEAAEAAERDLEAALSAGDATAAAKAQRRIARAESQLVALQNGKAAIEAEIEEAKNRPAPKPQESQQSFEQVIDSWNYPDNAKRWLKDHQDWLTNERKRAKLNAVHYDAIDNGHAEYSPAYFEYVEAQLGLRKSSQVEKEEPEEEEDTSSVVSAPVSRETPSNDGSRRNSDSVRLSVAEREAAKMAGITEAEYAKQKRKLQAEKDSGNYGERR